MLLSHERDTKGVWLLYSLVSEISLGWLAEHCLLMGIETKIAGVNKKHYIAAGFPRYTHMHNIINQTHYSRGKTRGRSLPGEKDAKMNMLCPVLSLSHSFVFIRHAGIMLSFNSCGCKLACVLLIVTNKTQHHKRYSS